MPFKKAKSYLKRVKESTKENVKESVNVIISKESVLSKPTSNGKVWEICIIESGKSINGLYYESECLEEACDVFEGLKVYAHKYGDTLDHRPDELPDPSLFFANYVGFIKDVKYVSTDSGSKLVAKFHCTSDAIRNALKNTWSLDQGQMPGFSIDSYVKIEEEGGIKKVTKISEANSLDIVTSPSAGGAFERLVASIQKNTKQENEMEKFLKLLLAMIKGGAVKMEGIEGKSDEEIITLLTEKFSGQVKEGEEPAKEAELTEDMVKALLDEQDIEAIHEKLKQLLDSQAEDEKVKEAAKKAEDDIKAKEATDKAKATDRLDELEKQNAINSTEKEVGTLLAKESKMSDIAKQKVVTQFNGRAATFEEIGNAIKIEKEYLDRITESQNDKVGARHGGTIMMDAPIDKMQKAVDLLIDPDLKRAKESADDYKDIPEFSGLREALSRIHGVDLYSAFADNTGRQNAAQRVKESASGDFAVMLGDSMNKRMFRMYNFMKAREIWTKFVTEESFNNLNQQKLVRIGGFSELATIAEAGTYPSMDTPSEENPTYDPLKKGGIFTLTEEMLINDNLRAIKQFPIEMARAAIHTLNKYIFDLIGGCDGSDTLNTKNIYDGTALYTEAHGNLISAALSSTTFESAMQKMADQAQADSGIPLGLNGKYLLTPNELRKTAWDVTVNELTQANANGGSVQNAQSRYAVEPLNMPKGYMCNVANFFMLIADPIDIEGLTVGYFNNKREPEILLQDQPTIGNVFTNDQIKYKVKFRYGATITDYRAFQGYMGTS